MHRILKHFIVFRSIRGRQFLSLWAAKLFEKSGIRGVFGLNLVAAVVLTGIISPEVENALNHYSIANTTTTTPISAHITTETTFVNPLASFDISQSFAYWHPGIDLTAPLNTPIYAIEDGIVETAETSLFGYGKHVIVAHDHDIKSLYAHMSEIATVAGRKVSRGELIGYIGSTGWATGNHLHLEIAINGVPVNPLEVLPINN